jgi:hypothetical protein
MAKISYVERRFKDSSLAVVYKANEILEEYAAQGYDLTLRQLYYQFVSRGLVQNNMREYKNLGNIVNDGRLAGLIDWDHIVDRTRNIRGNNHWGDPSQIIDACAAQFQIDKWETQSHRVEVWIEKDALIGVIENVCKKLDISYFSCRGYVSQSEIHEAAKDRLIPFQESGQTCIILHLGDHDPSGIDMSRDIQDRLEIFGCHARVKRIALNMNQVRQYNPPPNPAKLTDSRSTSYVENFGEESWELDALEPKVIGKLITDEVTQLINQSAWSIAVNKEKVMKNRLKKCSDRWDKVINFLEDSDEVPEDEDN